MGHFPSKGLKPDSLSPGAGKGWGAGYVWQSQYTFFCKPAPQVRNPNKRYPLVRDSQMMSQYGACDYLGKGREYHLSHSWIQRCLLSGINCTLQSGYDGGETGVSSGWLVTLDTERG